MGVKLGRREEYAIDYVAELLKMYKKTDHDAIFIKNFWDSKMGQVIQKIVPWRLDKCNFGTHIDCLWF